MAWTREQWREYGRKWRAKNRDKINARQRAAYGDNPQKWISKSKAWALENADKLREYNRRRNAARPGHRHSLSRDEWDGLLVAQAGRCAGCGDPMVGKSEPHVDHDHQCCGRWSCGRCVRAMLCCRCNHVLGIVGDDSWRLKQLARYLEQWRRSALLDA